MDPARVPPFFCVPLDAVVFQCPDPYPAYVRADVLLARFDAGGRFRLLSVAWEALLGFHRGELHGRGLLALLPQERRGAAALALGRMLSPAEADPVALELARRDGTLLRMRCYRRFDPYDETLFIACEPAGLTGAKYPAPSDPDRA